MKAVGRHVRIIRKVNVMIMVKVVCRNTSAATPNATSEPKATVAAWRASVGRSTRSDGVNQAAGEERRQDVDHRRQQHGAENATDAPGLPGPVLADKSENAAESAPRKSMRKRVICLFGRNAPGSKIRNCWMRFVGLGRNGAGKVRKGRPDSDQAVAEAAWQAELLLAERSRPRTRRPWRLWKTLAFELPRFGNRGCVV
jgi:hypothetical protein